MYNIIICIIFSIIFTGCENSSSTNRNMLTLKKIWKGLPIHIFEQPNTNIQNNQQQTQTTNQIRFNEPTQKGNKPFDVINKKRGSMLKKNGIDSKLLSNLLVTGFKVISSIEKEDGLIFELKGPTGVGKSSLVNYLSGHKYVKKKIKKRRKDLFNKKYEEFETRFELAKNTKEAAKVGHSLESTTLYPALYNVNLKDNLKQNILLCDCAGDQDNRGEEYRICISLLNYLVTQLKNNNDLSQKLKGIGFVISKHDILAERGAIFNKIIENINYMFEDCDQDEIFESLCFFFSKFEENESINDVVELLVKAKNTKQSQLSKYGRQEDADQYLLLEKMLKYNNLFLINLLDGIGRKKILKKIKNLPGIDSKKIRFDPCLKNQFKKLVIDIIDLGNKNFTDFLSIPNAIQDLEKDLITKEKEIEKEILYQKHELGNLILEKEVKINNCLNRLEELKKEILADKKGQLDNEKKLENEINRTIDLNSNKKNEVQQKKNLLVLKENEINDFNKAIEFTKEKCVSCQKLIIERREKLSNLDLKKPQKYWESRKYDEQAKYGQVLKGVINKEPNIIEYHDLPFLSIKEHYNVGKSEQTIYEPNKGKLECCFETDPVTYSTYQVDVYVESQLLPEMQLKLKVLNDSIKTLELRLKKIEDKQKEHLAKKNELEKETLIISSEIKQLENEIINENTLLEVKKDALKNGGVFLENQTVDLENQIQNTESELQNINDKYNLLIEKVTKAKVDLVSKQEHIKNKLKEEIAFEKSKLEKSIHILENSQDSFELLKKIAENTNVLENIKSADSFLKLYTLYKEKAKIIILDSNPENCEIINHNNEEENIISEEILDRGIDDYSDIDIDDYSANENKKGSFTDQEKSFQIDKSEIIISNENINLNLNLNTDNSQITNSLNNFNINIDKFIDNMPLVKSQVNYMEGCGHANEIDNNINSNTISESNGLVAKELQNQNINENKNMDGNHSTLAFQKPIELENELNCNKEEQDNLTLELHNIVEPGNDLFTNENVNINSEIGLSNENEIDNNADPAKEGISKNAKSEDFDIDLISIYSDILPNSQELTKIKPLLTNDLNGFTFVDKYITDINFDIELNDSDNESNNSDYQEVFVSNE